MRNYDEFKPSLGNIKPNIWNFKGNLCSRAKDTIETKERLGILFHRNRCPVKAYLHYGCALRCVTLPGERQIIETPIVFSRHATPRNATRSHDGNTALQYIFYHVTVSLSVDDCVTITSAYELGAGGGLQPPDSGSHYFWGKS